MSSMITINYYASQKEKNALSPQLVANTFYITTSLIYMGNIHALGVYYMLDSINTSLLLL